MTFQILAYLVENCGFQGKNRVCVITPSTLRASKSSHVIASFQTYSSENLEYDEVINQDYHKLTQDDWVLKVGQETINILSDHARSVVYGGIEIAETSY